MDNKVIIKRINDWLECYQNKDNGYYNATALLKQYNEHYPNEKKIMYDFLRLDNVKRFIEKVEKTQLIDNHHKGKNPHGDNQQVKPFDKKKEKTHMAKTQDADYQVLEKSRRPDNQQVKPFYKKKGRTLQNGKQIPDTYYFHSSLFLKFGAWLNTDLEYDIYVVISNLVLEYRNNITKLMPEFKEAIKDFKTKGNIFVKVHSMLNKAIFGKYEKNGKQLNKGSESELFRYNQLQSEIVTLIKYNIIKDYEDLKSHIQGYYL